MDILAGDIGGTNTRLALFSGPSPTELVPINEKVYPSRDYDNLDAILSAFMALTGQPVRYACFGIAGPIIDQRCEATNLPWVISAAALRDQFDLSYCHLLNDLEANAWGINTLQHDDLYTLNEGRTDQSGNASIISAGSGLGEAGMFWDGQQHWPFPSEGGHTDFSPTTSLEYELNDWLTHQFGRVSWERVGSGPGLVHLYDFLCFHHDSQTPGWLQDEMTSTDKAQAISNNALNEKDPLCVEALDLFIDLYGREAGNHALKIMAVGGVYLGGGIAPKILPKLRQGRFIDAFNQKGRMSELTQSMPVKVILNDKTALKGAAYYCARFSGATE